MIYSRDDLKTSFEIPDTLTVREQLQFFSIAMLTRDRDNIERKWLGAQQLIKAWKSEIVPDRNIDLDSVTNPSVTDVILWVSLTVTNHINALRDVPKN